MAKKIGNFKYTKNRFNKNKTRFNTHQWQLLIDFVNIFDGSTGSCRQNKDNYTFVWQKIVLIREQIYEDIDKVLRGLFELYCITGEKKQFSELNKTLFRLNHLCEQKFYDYNKSETGLVKFLKLLKTTYASDNLVIKEMELAYQLFNFIKQHHHEYLIKEYKYLENISLPVKDYEDIRLNLFTILKRFNELYPIVSNPEFFNEVNEDINQFKTIYMKKYINEHKLYHEKLKNFYNKLHNLPEYKTLNALSKIKSTNKVKPIKQYVENFFPDQCSVENLDKLLLNKPKCKCGFTLGSSLVIPPLGKITPMLKKGINDYREQLQNYKTNFRITKLPYS